MRAIDALIVLASYYTVVAGIPWLITEVLDRRRSQGWDEFGDWHTGPSGRHYISPGCCEAAA